MFGRGGSPRGCCPDRFCYVYPPLRKVYVLMPHKDANHEPEIRPPAGPAPRPPRGMAKVLERAIAPDLVPPVVQRGNLQIDTATYIAEFADIARHQGPWAAAGAAYPWLNPQET
jgi:hypothetical protein